VSRRSRWLLGAALALLVLPLLGLLWLLGSGGGRDLALSLATQQLPEGALRIGTAQGRLAGPLILRDVEYAQDGLQVRIGELTLDHSLARALGRRLDVRNLHLAEVDVVLPEAVDDGKPLRLQAPERLPWPDLRLPLTVNVAQLRVETMQVRRAQETLLRLQALEADALSLRREGALSVERLAVRGEAGALSASAELALAGVADGRLDAAWRFSGEADAAANLTLTASQGQLALALDAPSGERLRLDLASDLDWTFAASAAAFDPQRWRLADGGEPVALQLSARGSGQDARLQGEIASGGQSLRIDAAQLRLIDDGGGLRWQPLRLSPGSGGSIESEGRLLFDPLQLELDAQLRALALPSGEPAPILDGHLRAEGPLDALRLTLDRATLRQGELTAEVELLAQLLSGGARIERLAITQDAGGIEASGDLAWAPALAGQFEALVDRFDPAALLPSLPGNVNGRLRLQLDEDAKGPRLRLDVDQLGGQLRQRPLAGQGWLGWHDGLASGDLSLRLGESRLSIQGESRQQMDLALRAAPLRLEDLLPGASGRLEADLRLRGAQSAPRLSGRAQGQVLRVDTLAIEALDIDLDVELGTDPDGRAALRVAGLDAGEQRLDIVELDLDGGRAAHALTLSAQGPRLRLAAALDGALAGEDWRGRLGQLELRLGEAEVWRLQAPAALGWVKGVAQIDDACLADGGRGRLCLAADGAPSGFSARGSIEGLVLQPLLDALGGAEIAIDGELQGDFTLSGRDGRVREGQASLRLPAGALAEPAIDERVLLRWRDLGVDAVWTPSTLTVELSGDLDDGGRIDGRLEGGSPLADPEAEFSGRIDLRLPDLTAIEPLLPQLAAIQGSLRAGGELSGRWRAPVVAGSLEVEGFGAEVPAAGLHLRDSMLTLRSDGSRIDIDGLLDSGEGKLLIDGALDGVFDGRPSGRVRVRGERFHVADTPFVRLWASPDIEARLNERGITLRGKVVIPEAKLDLERLEGSAVRSDDVVVVDPDQPPASAIAQRLQATIDVELGDKVTLRGFGFDGGISGSLQVSERSGRPTTARGTLNVRGDYRAYGQDLDIERGRLLFSASPIDNPGLDVRAQRVVDSVKVGIEVSGDAKTPMLTVWSEPAMDQAEALSYLVLGRPLRAASSAEGAQLGEAAAAIGGNFLAGKLGSRLGFDTFGVADSQALGGAAFTVGKYLSPALYLSYGVSLFGSGQVMTLRYLLSDKFDVEIESGSESRAGINYHYER